MPDRQCAGCENQDEWGCFAKKFREPTEDEDPREAWYKPAHLPVEVDGEETFACPRQPLREEPIYWRTVLTYYGMYLKGFLPQAGAIVDQSNKAIELFQILDEVNSECDRKKDGEATRPKGDPFNGGR